MRRAASLMILILLSMTIFTIHSEGDENDERLVEGSADL